MQCFNAACVPERRLVHYHQIYFVSLAHFLVIKPHLIYVQLPHTNNFSFLFSFSCFADDCDQFSLLVETDDGYDVSSMAQRENKRKNMNLDMEQYFLDGYYVCPNAKCDRK